MKFKHKYLADATIIIIAFAASNVKLNADYCDIKFSVVYVNVAHLKPDKQRASHKSNLSPCQLVLS